MKHEYEGEGIKVIWNPDQCVHSTKCWKSMLKVFDPRKHPWVDVNAATAEEIAAQIDQCPSGALSYELKPLKPKNLPTK